VPPKTAKRQFKEWLQQPEADIEAVPPQIEYYQKQLSLDDLDC